MNHRTDYWTRVLAAQLSRGIVLGRAAELADEALVEFDKRFTTNGTARTS